MKTHKIKTSRIDWDTDGDSEAASSLPQEVVIRIESSPGLDLEQEITDALSDRHGFCVKAVEFEMETTCEECKDLRREIADLKEAIELIHNWQRRVDQQAGVTSAYF